MVEQKLKMQEMSIEELINFLQRKDSDYVLKVRVYEQPHYILVGIDKEVSNEGNQDLNPKP